MPGVHPDSVSCVVLLILYIQIDFLDFIMTHGSGCVERSTPDSAESPERWHTVTWFTPTQNVTLSTLSKHFLMANIITINMIIIKLF